MERRVQGSLRLATIMVQVINPIVFEAPTSVDTVGIALATYNPNPALFARQIDSIRRQSHRDWICVVSDDCSSPTFLGEMQAVLKTTIGSGWLSGQAMRGYIEILSALLLFCQKPVAG